jgi:HK97 family phage prohead protease
MDSELPYETKEYKIYGFDENGEFTGLASVYGIKDHGDDVVVKGAFSRTINNHQGVVKLLWQHDTRTPIGLGEISDTDKGLQIKGKLNLNVQAGKEAYELLKQKAVDGLSIGYDPVDWEYKDGARYLKEIRLWEVSVVTFPMNPESLVADVKARKAKTVTDSIAILEGALKTNEVDTPTIDNLLSLLAATKGVSATPPGAEVPDGTEANPATVIEEVKAEAEEIGDSEELHSLMELLREMKGK